MSHNQMIRSIVTETTVIDFKNFLTSCPSEQAFPILLRHKQATVFFPNRIHRNVPSSAMRAVKMDL